jgi:uncharacterized membrane protein
MAGDESPDSDASQSSGLIALALRAMLEILGHWFAAVCGQDPGHTWAPGGVLLPCCQRCAGLYVGAGVAALLHLGLKPRLNGRFLEIHGAFLLAMVPFGFHWIAQGGLLRSLTGVLFGFGVVTFLCLPLNQTRDKAEGQNPRAGRNPKAEIRNHQPPAPTTPLSEPNPVPVQPSDFGVPSAFGLRASGFPRSPGQRQLAYFLFLLATLLLLPAIATQGGAFAAYSLSAFAFWGALALAALVAANISLALLGTVRRLRRLTLACLQP